nr:hypothetical protein [uncultured Blautia sp.]
MEKIFLPYLDTVCDEVTLEFEHESKQDIIKMKPRSAKSPYIKEKIASVNHLFQLQKRWSGQLERYFYTRMQDCEYREITNIGELEKEMQKDLDNEKRKVKSCPEFYIDMQYLKWIKEKQLKAFYSNLKQTGIEPVIEE